MEEATRMEDTTVPFLLTVTEDDEDTRSTVVSPCGLSVTDNVGGPEESVGGGLESVCGGPESIAGGGPESVGGPPRMIDGPPDSATEGHDVMISGTAPRDRSASRATPTDDMLTSDVVNGKVPADGKPGVVAVVVIEDELPSVFVVWDMTTTTLTMVVFPPAAPLMPLLPSTESEGMTCEVFVDTAAVEGALI